MREAELKVLVGKRCYFFVLVCFDCCEMRVPSCVARPILFHDGLLLWLFSDCFSFIESKYLLACAIFSLYLFILTLMRLGYIVLQH